ncbi:hypothetical protein K488DRAFT_44802 [Vararia minispora EC-137]|uniref:Uncharacterized protein n=1 Tax=Vararia minispora EC-137 TaxID=1314806 RepID=A0ACB8QSE6_9AGAM|nr:hypothetical protein K488DRAFT_44802 [Vararia minispora EC-137]
MADVQPPPQQYQPPPQEEGLTYPPGFLSSLPVLLSRPAPHSPIRQLSAAQFADILLRSQLAHAPDGVLFPFLHGLEGDNEAQNSFFATGYTRTPDGRRGRPKVPQYRGLIWSAVEGEDDESEGSDDDDDYDGYSSGIDIDVDPDNDDTFAMDMDTEPEPVPESAYMHPVQTRAAAAQPPQSPSSPPLNGDPTTTLLSSGAPPRTGTVPQLTSTFKARELLETNGHGEARFGHVRVPEGISLRNFGIQVVSALFDLCFVPGPAAKDPRALAEGGPIYATLSDVVVYSRRGAHRAAFALAEKFKQAIEAKYAERTPVAEGEPEPVRYNVFVLHATPEDIVRELGHALVRTDTDAPHTDGHDAHVEAGPHRANTVNFAQREKDEMRDLTRASEILVVGGDDDARAGRVFLGNSNDVPLAPNGELPAHWSSGPNDLAKGFGYDVCIECHDRAPAPAAPLLRASEEHLTALAVAWTRTGEPGERPPPHPSAVIHLPFPSSPTALGSILPFLEFLQRILEPSPAPDAQLPANWLHRFRSTRPAGRGARVLIWSSDGYTESSFLALCLLMAVRGLSLAEAYLELQVEKKRSFFVYQTDLPMLRRVDAKLRQPATTTTAANTHGHSRTPSLHEHGRPIAIHRAPSHAPPGIQPSSLPASYPTNGEAQAHLRRPRASTSPLLPSLVADHQLWFDDPRFDGSFPSRVLPFLYLGNLNHASNAYMLHALGITHVVSVGECALVPPPELAGSSAVCSTPPATTPAVAPGAPTTHAELVRGAQGSLWIEEREGRIKVLDIKGVCDDGIDTLEPQLEPICEWIEKARREGGQVLVHCRVGVSRSATVTIAYVMKHLNLPLVDAYLIVRSRRLSVLIQPNMRLLYNLCGWEVKLARERAAGDAKRLREEMARSLNWPYLAREVHALNEKYLH